MIDFIYTHEHISKVANAIWQKHSTKKVWAIFAPMGAGKTTFTHILCNEILKISSVVNSPTFSIINQYESPIVGTVLHMDWYRLKDMQEAIDAGVEDALLSGNLCLIEWPEKASELLPSDALLLAIEIIDAHTRRIFNKEVDESEE